MRLLCSSILLGLLCCALPAAAEPLDLAEELKHNAERQLFFKIPEGDVTYLARHVEYWGAGFDEQGLTEKYPADQWSAFELGELKRGRTRVVAMIAMNEQATELMEFLEEGDVLTLKLSYEHRFGYQFTDPITDQEEERELILLEVEQLSYRLPRIEGYSVLWYDHAAPDNVTERTHLSQGELARIGSPLNPGSTIEVDLSPGGIHVIYFPDGDALALPVKLETKASGPLVFGVLSGKMGFRMLDAGDTPDEGDHGEQVVALDIPADLTGKDLWVVRTQPSSTFFLVHVPQEAARGFKVNLVVGEAPGRDAEPSAPAE